MPLGAGAGAICRCRWAGCDPSAGRRAGWRAVRRAGDRLRPGRCGDRAAGGRGIRVARAPARSGRARARDRRPALSSAGADRPDSPAASSAAFERCLAVGGGALSPADTVYGLACDPSNRIAVERLYLLKRRPLAKSSAVMFFDVELALAALAELGSRTREALPRLLPGAVTLLLPNPGERFPLACGGDVHTLGLRVPVVSALADVRWPVLQSSANRAGGPDPRGVHDVPELIRAAGDLVRDGGGVPGVAAAVVGLGHSEAGG